MKEENKNKTKWLHLRLSSAEHEQLQKLFRKSTCRKMSDFARKNLLQKPVILRYRNESLDDLMTELILLRKDLNGIGNNFNQAVKKLHTLRQIPEFKHWLAITELEKKILFNAINSIKKNIENLSKKWLQS
ncbi:plasmid mobilization protein [Flavobacterium fluviatile]|uniref:plasmid mobilization protein n=1 Tax=Flavobacterium fluviatile TaxID=1862387 RepID=UPI0013D4DA36|nr:plasmid mobilization relaxosome protein MobC [Flavobacterium fluviatile]